jgi:hypothetical protein
MGHLAVLAARLSPWSAVTRTTVRSRPPLLSDRLEHPGDLPIDERDLAVVMAPP